MLADAPLSLDELRQRSARSLLALALRGGAGKVISMASLVLLSRLLTPGDFGVFAILSLPVGLLELVADAGISAALVQRGDGLTAEVERAGFTLRVGLSLVFGAALMAGAGIVGRVYDLGGGQVWALRALALGPLINTLGLVPTVRLSRALRFERLAAAEIGSLVAGQAAAVGGALAGLGLWSLVLGGVTTSAAGTLLVNVAAPWRPGLAVAPGAMRALLRFGLPYQSQGLLHLAIDNVIPALGGLWLSGAGVGYLSWSKDIARWPRIPADYVARVGFPAYARLQGDAEALSRLIQEALTLVCAITFPVTALGVAAAPLLVGPVFGAEWLPAVGPLVVFLLRTPFDALATVLLPVIYATGHAGRGLRISAAWAALIWALSLGGLVWFDGLLIIPIAFTATTAIMTIAIAASLPDGIHIRWWPSVIRPLALSAVLGAAALIVVGGLR